jgi:prophage DNA circulation protein
MGFLDIQLYPASFRGAQFNYTTGSNTAGRKTVVHEFPNKTFRYIEDLGKNLKSLSITGLVHGPTWLQDKLLLEKALNEEGIGILMHPFYGNINCVCTGYTVTDDDKEIGVATFEMTFMEANENVFPQPTGNNRALIATKAREIYNNINNYIANTFSTVFVRNIQDAGNVLQTLVAELSLHSSVANAELTAKSAFDLLLDSYDSDKYTMPQDPPVLADRTTELITSFDSLPQTDEDIENINNKLFGFGEDVAPINVTSEEYIEKNKNRTIIYGSINGLALANLYENAVVLDYQDEIQLNNKIIDLEDKYQRLVFGDNNSLDDDTLTTLFDLRDEWRKFYENLRLSINKVTEITTKQMPLKVMVYQYYGSIEEYDTIMQLNNIRNPALIEGNFDILTQ